MSHKDETLKYLISNETSKPKFRKKIISSNIRNRNVLQAQNNNFVSNISTQKSSVIQRSTSRYGMGNPNNQIKEKFLLLLLNQKNKETLI